MDTSELQKEFNKSKFVSCISKKELQEIIDSQDSIKLFANNELIGFANSRRLTKDWYNIGPVYLLKIYRNKKKGAKLIRDIHLLCIKKKGSIIATTLNPKVKHTLESLGYQKVSLGNLPLRVKLALLKKIANRKLICYIKKGTTTANWERYVYSNKK